LTTAQVTAAKANLRPVRATTPPVLRTVSAGGLDQLRRQSPLPETVDELCRVAGFTKASVEDVVVGGQATETKIKALSDSGRLADARVVHFATHGLLAGETALFTASKAEPALMLTPPETASETDDGLLTASEVAGLKLDADWVVLSACNTASGDDIGAEALSGLARAFFYAGARSLLVSHWAVDSQATVALVTAAFEAMAAEPGLSQGQALARAMTALIGSGGRAAHPRHARRQGRPGRCRPAAGLQGQRGGVGSCRSFGSPGLAAQPLSKSPRLPFLTPPEAGWAASERAARGLASP
jgi:CHAT domain-containing protein